MPFPEFDIYPYVGALPVRFGTARADVPPCIGLPAKHAQKDDEWFGSVRVAYDDAGEVVELGFGPRDVVLSFLGTTLWSDDCIQDPMPTFLGYDAEPVEFYGFIIFPKIGITCTGFHDEQPSQRAITVFRRGRWDEILPKAKRPDLSRYQR